MKFKPGISEMCCKYSLTKLKNWGLATKQVFDSFYLLDFRATLLECLQLLDLPNVVHIKATETRLMRESTSASIRWIRKLVSTS